MKGDMHVCIYVCIVCWCVCLIVGLVRESCLPMIHLTGQLQMAINEMFIPRDRIRLEQAIGNGTQ